MKSRIDVLGVSVAYGMTNGGNGGQVRRLGRSGQGDKIVFTDALQDEKDRGCIACISNEVRPLRPDCKRLARKQSYLVFGVLQKDTDRSGHDIKSVVDVVVIVPRHLLRGADLQLRDAKTRAHSVI